MASSSESFTESSDSEVEVGLFVVRCAIWYHLYNLKNVRSKKKTKCKCKVFVIQTKLFIHLAYVIFSL